MAFAEAPALTAEMLAGRWTSEKVIFDITQCGQGWCGVAVMKNAACGKTMLRVGSGTPDEPRPAERSMAFEGQLERADRTEPYGVKLVLSRGGENGSLRLRINGHSGGLFAPMRRTYDYNELLSRAGDAWCRPDSKVS